MTGRPSRPRRLIKSDDVTQFDSGAAELDRWLAAFAWENLRSNNAITYVSTASERVAGYYAIAAGGVDLVGVPAASRKGSRPDPMPVIVLARLAVDRSLAGQGVGAGLLLDALQRAAALSGSLGAAALLVHARDTEARDFYLHNGDFLVSPVADLQQFVPTKRLTALFQSGTRRSAEGRPFTCEFA